jgi:4-amino-4-deoxy-L-arabinose transferase-like glycosyltransferase
MGLGMSIGRLYKIIRPFKFSVLMVAMLGVCVLAYRCFGHTLIQAVYEGKTISIFDSLIRYQYKKPVEHYTALGDRLFWELCVTLGVGSTLLVLIGECLVFYRKRQTPVLAAVDRPNEAQARMQLPWKCLIAIYLLSLLIRGSFLPWVSKLPLASDENYYWSVSHSLTDGNFAATVHRPPLWGYVLGLPAAIYDDPFSGRILSVILGSFAPVFVALLATRVFDRKTGVGAALLYAIYPEHVFYSHYVWSELLFGLLSIVVVYLFVLYVQKPTKKLFVGTFVAAGVTLLAKEFAVVIFAALALTLLCTQVRHKLQKVIVASLIFFSFATVYSGVASLMTRRIVVLNDAMRVNFRLATQFRAEEINHEAAAAESSPRWLGFEARLKAFRRQFFHLWTVNSFPAARLLGRHMPETWSYGFSRPWPLVYLLVGYYIAIMGLGIAGLCLARLNIFWVFSVLVLGGLSATALFCFLCSRFRLPFMFVPVIYAAHLLMDHSALATNLRNPLRSSALIALIWLFSHITRVTVPMLGGWG